MAEWRFDLGVQRDKRKPKRQGANVTPSKPTTKPEVVTHFLRANKRSTACGRRASTTLRDTRKKHKVTCKVCLRALEVGEV